jgi:anti-sigma B factor antagonist
MQATIERVGDVTVAVLPGESLDASNAKAFRQDIASVLATGAKVIFDLSNVQFIDSSGLGALLSCLRHVHAAGGQLKLCALAKPVWSLFELVRMDRIFDILATRGEAIDAFQRNQA